MPKISLVRKSDDKTDSDVDVDQSVNQSTILIQTPQKGRGRGRGAKISTPNNNNTLTRISIVSQSISTPQHEQSQSQHQLNDGMTKSEIPLTKLSDRLETQISRQRKSQFNNDVNEKTFSLIDRVSETTATQESHNEQPIRQNTCIVCLKINKSLFQQIFNAVDIKSLDNKKNPSKIDNMFISPDESNGNLSAELQMELSHDKTLNVPEIYGITPLDIQPEKVNFKQYSDIDEECLNQKINSHSLSDKKIHLVLASFKNKSWPSSSPYVCWNCTEPFDGAPSGIPTIAMSDSYEDTYYLEGNFCSMNCAARHLFNTHQAADSQLFTIFEIMNFIYNSINGSTEYQKIKLAPERTCLKKFGGYLSIDDYRKNFFTNVSYELFKSPLIPALYHIAENVDLTKLIKNQSNKNLPNKKKVNFN